MIICCAYWCYGVVEVMDGSNIKEGRVRNPTYERNSRENGGIDDAYNMVTTCHGHKSQVTSQDEDIVRPASARAVEPERHLHSPHLLIKLNQNGHERDEDWTL